MSAKTKLAGFITERDQRLFQFLFENKVASIAQMKQSVFSNVSRQMAYRRISQLAQAGWIDKQGFSNGKTLQHVCSLTEASYRKYVFNEGINDQRQQFKSEKILHDLALVDIRNRLEKQSLVKKIYTENVLRSLNELSKNQEFKAFITVRSDAVVEIRSQESHQFIVPLEYEASLKSKERCQQKLLDYYIKYDGTAVLFICNNDAVLKRMSQIEKDLSHNYTPKMYFSLLGDVKKDTEKVIFTNPVTDKRVVL